jgi:hypothetical protein
MYREPYDAFVEKIGRLERELGEIASVRRPLRERLLWFVTAASLLLAVFSCTALVASREHVRQLEGSLDQARVGLDDKRQALSECESVAANSVNAERLYAVAIERYRTWGCSP